MLKVFEAFSGVGAQRMALRNLGIEHESVGVSEIDIPALISYSAIHEDLANVEIGYPSKEEMIEYLESKRIGLDVKTGKIKLPKQLDKLKQIYKATILSKCVGDISLIDPNELPDMDLFTYSFPCQDLSVAGQRAGMIKGQTRSGLLYECEKIIEAKRPKYLLLENVKNLVGKNFKPQFNEWLTYLETLGYTNYWQVLNAKHYGVPQNRERVFVVSILGEHEPYEFPTPIPLTRVVKDILEDEVEERYYMNKPFKLVNHHQDMTRTDVFLSQIDRLLQKMDEIPSVICVDKSINNPQLNSIVNCITAREDRGISNRSQEGTAIVSNEPKILAELTTTSDYRGGRNHPGIIVRGNSNPSQRGMNGQIYDSQGLSPTLTTNKGEGNKYVIYPTEQFLELNTNDTSNTLTTVQKDNYVMEEVIQEVKRLAQKTRKEPIEVTIKPNKDLRPHRLDPKKSGLSELNINYDENCAHVVTTTHAPKIYGISTDFRVRKLTPLECWRLMGFSDDDFNQAKSAGTSNSQLYKQAGNSIVVPVLEGIFEQLIDNTKER